MDDLLARMKHPSPSFLPSTTRVITARLRDFARHAHRSAASLHLGRVEDLEKWKTRLVGEAPVVALGKFDAMHVGHRALATTAAEMGHPWLISFKGMAQVMGWDVNRLPLVAEDERPVVLGMWKEACFGRTPHMRYLPFAEIRQQSPKEFVQLLVEELGVVGVVAGANYRFGYKASGDASMLQQLAKEFGIQSKIVDLIESNHTGPRTQVSSSRVRQALADGNMDAVYDCLGRPYVLILDTSLSHHSVDGRTLFPPSSFINQSPKNGSYLVHLDNNNTQVEFMEDGVMCSLMEEMQPSPLLRLEFL